MGVQTVRDTCAQGRSSKPGQTAWAANQHQIQHTLRGKEPDKRLEREISMPYGMYVRRA